MHMYGMNKGLSCLPCVACPLVLGKQQQQVQLHQLAPKILAFWLVRAVHIYHE